VEKETATRISKYIVQLPSEFDKNFSLFGRNLQDKKFFGIDPGSTNLGLSEVRVFYSGIMTKAILYQIKMPRTKLVDRIDQLDKVLSKCFNTFVLGKDKMFAVIEGASYGSMYRQTELAEVRAIIAEWLKRNGVGVIQVVPPTSIRKRVFGSGKVLAQDAFITDENIPDAVTALSCVYYAMLGL
jgi:Holliday junction resolvasome RuvABC endonuclease subunit